MIRVFSKDDTSIPLYHHCLRKRRYADVEAAKDAAKRMTKRYKTKFAVYRCHYCSYWHVGTDRTKTFKYLNRKGIWGKNRKNHNKKEG